MVEAMVGLAYSLGVKMLAEGVETDGEFEALCDLNCDFVQGIGLARPMPAHEVISWNQRYEQAIEGASNIAV